MFAKTGSGDDFAYDVLKIWMEPRLESSIEFGDNGDVDRDLLQYSVFYTCVSRLSRFYLGIETEPASPLNDIIPPMSCRCCAGRGYPHHIG